MRGARGSRSEHERGAILGMVIFIALIASIAAITVLQIAVAQARQAKFYSERTRSRYAAEAGLVWAQQNLYTNPTWQPAGPLPVPVGGTVVNVVVTVAPPCGAPPCPNQTISSKVTY